MIAGKPFHEINFYNRVFFLIYRTAVQHHSWEHHREHGQSSHLLLHCHIKYHHFTAQLHRTVPSRHLHLAMPREKHEFPLHGSDGTVFFYQSWANPFSPHPPKHHHHFFFNFMMLNLICVYHIFIFKIANFFLYIYIWC